MDAPLGARVLGVDLSQPIHATTVARITEAWRQRLVLVFPDQVIDDDQLIAFTRLFGDLDPPGPNPYGAPFLSEHPEINVISNVLVDGRPIGNLGAGEAIWHADMTYTDTPPMGAVLLGLEIPEGEGNTYFANMYAAFEALPSSLRMRIEGKLCIHDATYNSAGMMRKGYKEVTDPRTAPGARHPLVIRHPHTGRPALFLGRRRNACIVGFELADSEALLDALWAHATQPRFALTHVWRRGDVLMWDNMATLHRRDAFAETARRVLHRTQIKGIAAPTAA
ncbi:MAG: TauD/TfdA family dioxygenase [Alphaproteobacteria bacterium]|nr:TauD/TfdA family dioxygenase [Alphaproteobacteria bacterium]